MAIASSRILDAEGKEIGSGGHYGCCTGIFCYSLGYDPQEGHIGHYPKRQPGSAMLHVEFSDDDDDPPYNWEEVLTLINSPVVQSLCPGTKVHKKKDYTVIFPIADIPSDRVICAMRLINTMCNGYYRDNMDLLEDEGEDWLKKLEPWQQLIIAMFGVCDKLDSDSQASLSYYPPGTHRYEGEIPHGKYSKSHWGRVLSLLQGKTHPGWMPTIEGGGYFKQHNVASYLDGRQYTSGHAQRYQEEMKYLFPAGQGFVYTVNGPLIDQQAIEGPIVYQEYWDVGKTQDECWKDGIAFLKQHL